MKTTFPVLPNSNDDTQAITSLGLPIIPWGVALRLRTQVNILVKANRVTNAMRVLRDGGSIYAWGMESPGLIIEKNVLTQQTHPYGALYLDAYTQYITAKDNIIFNNPCSLLINGGSHTLTNNYWGGFTGECGGGGKNLILNNDPPTPNRFPCTDSSVKIPDGTKIPCGPNTFTNNHIITSLSQAPADIIGNAGVISSYTVPSFPTNPSDLNTNGKVDIYDFNILVTNFGKTGVAGWIRADIIKNGVVDIFDFNTLVANYGKTFN